MASAGECSHCGLRLGRRGFAATVAGEPGEFCCGGCFLAAHVTRARGDASVASALMVRVGLAAFFAMNVMMVSLPTWARHVYGGAAEGPLFVVLRVLAGILAIPVLILLGGPLVRGAWAGLARGRANAEALVALGVASAYVLSAGNLATGRPDVYFDTAVTLLVVITAGRAFEALAKARAGAALRAVEAGPAAALRVRGAAREEVAPEDLVPGDVFEVAPGGAFPTDGIVVDGEAEVDESALTGESRPVTKRVGSEVAGGTVSLDGRLRVRVVRVVGESALARIRKMLEAARAQPARIERAADRLAARLVPAILVLAAATGLWWTGTSGFDRGVLVAVSVLVVACPCGLALATPLAIRSALAAAARRGIVVRSAPLLERAAEVGRVLFDKTGTLTEPTPAVESIEVAAGGASADDLLAAAAAVEEGIPHPFARAIVREARRRGLVLPRADGARVRAGRGAIGRVDHRLVTVGRASLAFADVGVVASEPERGVVIATSAGDAARVHLRERLAPDGAEAVAELRWLGVGVGLASGDAPSSSSAVAGVFHGAEAAFGLAPEDKLAWIAELRRGSRGGAVAMVGDGINDAPALAAADLGIAVAGATDLARLSADVVVLGGGLRAVPWLLRHARRTRRIVRQNLLWSVVYNAAAVGLAVAGALDPITASLAMLGSSLFVVLNSRRLAADVRAVRGEASTAEPVRAIQRGASPAWRASEVIP